ncbi:MAG: HAD family hydrolase [Magnetococcales bacterium]|nr:HAD family hydrolase [Magnetococcales bacterium]HIJ83062.1 HAD-IA family hydrolase [Magnetococcales bacterium]
MFVFLDIGFTLMGGPSLGPAGRLIEQFSLPPDAKTLLNHLLFGTHLKTPEDLAQQLAQHYGLEKTSTLPFIEEVWHKQASEAFPLPGAKIALQRLHEARIPFGFISNIWAPFLEGFIRLFPTEYRQCPVFASFQVGFVKPDPELYLTALRQTGMDPQQTVMIGDTYAADIAPAQHLGMKTIWILTRPDKERADLVKLLNKEKRGPDQTLASIEHFHPEQLTTLFQTENLTERKL